MKTGKLPFGAESQPSSAHDKDGRADDEDAASAQANLDSFVPIVQSSDHWSSGSKAATSATLADLLDFLLEKRPMDRPSW